MSWKVSFRVFKTVEHCGKVKEKVEKTLGIYNVTLSRITLPESVL